MVPVFPGLRDSSHSITAFAGVLVSVRPLSLIIVNVIEHELEFPHSSTAVIVMVCVPGNKVVPAAGD